MEERDNALNGGADEELNDEESGETYDTYIERDEKFAPDVIVAPKQQVFLYRRLQDARHPYRIAVVDEDNSPIGYLERELAETTILPGLKEGSRYQCYISDDEEDGRIPLLITSLTELEVNEMLMERDLAGPPDGAAEDMEAFLKKLALLDSADEE